MCSGCSGDYEYDETPEDDMDYNKAQQEAKAKRTAWTLVRGHLEQALNLLVTADEAPTTQAQLMNLMQRCDAQVKLWTDLNGVDDAGRVVDPNEL